MLELTGEQAETDETDGQQLPVAAAGAPLLLNI
jgi:hypothetical protein